jgi:hypothetical protein
MDNFSLFLVNKHTNDKLTFARWANGKRFLFDVSMSMSPFLHDVSMLHVSMCPCLHVPMSIISTFLEFHKQKTQLTENGNFRLFSTNGKWERQTSAYSLQTETENWRLFSVVGKRWSIAASANLPIYASRYAYSFQCVTADRCLMGCVGYYDGMSQRQAFLVIWIEQQPSPLGRPQQVIFSN